MGELVKRVILLYVVLIATTLANAETYKWEDANGMHFTDNASSIPSQYRQKALENAGPDISPSKPKPFEYTLPQYNPPQIQPQYIPPQPQPQADVSLYKAPVVAPALKSPLTRKNHYNADKSLEKALKPLANIIATWVLIAVVAFIFWLCALVDILRSEFKNDNNKIVWLIVILLLPALGAVLYFIFSSDQKINRNKEQEELLARLRPSNFKDRNFDIK